MTKPGSHAGRTFTHCSTWFPRACGKDPASPWAGVSGRASPEQGSWQTPAGRPRHPGVGGAPHWPLSSGVLKQRAEQGGLTDAHGLPHGTAAPLLGLCKAFSFDCLLPCVRGRILSPENSLVRASAAVERKHLEPSSPLPGKAPSGPRSTHATQNQCSHFMRPFKAQGQGCLEATVPAAHPPSPHMPTWPCPVLSEGKPVSPASTLCPALL